jgi:hypothetical protein
LKATGSGTAIPSHATFIYTGGVIFSDTLARRLLDFEAVAGTTSARAESAGLRVYEKLRRRLCAVAGVAGFRSLAAGALNLALREAPDLGAVQVTADGYLKGVVEFTPQDDRQAGEVEVILIARLLDMLITFIGEALTLRIVQDEWPDATSHIADTGREDTHEQTR